MDKKKIKKTIQVVGWTDYDDEYFPEHEGDGGAFDAVVAEVREKGYLFGGDAHQDHSGCCPVLSDGTRVCFSWRGWGGVIAAAYNHKGKCSYMAGYMDELIQPTAICYPGKYVDFDKIETEKTVHELTLSSEREEFSFSLYHVCPKKILPNIKQGDYMILETPRPEYDYTETEGVKVKGVHMCDTLEELFDDLDDYVYDYEYFGFGKKHSREEIIEAIKHEYPDWDGTNAVFVHYEYTRDGDGLFYKKDET